MHNPTSVLENETHKILWNFVIQTDYLISARRPDIIIIEKKENLQKSKIERKRKEGKIPRPCQGIEKKNKLWEMKMMFIPIVIGVLGTVTRGFIKGAVDLGMTEQTETTQNTTLLRLVRIVRRFLET